MQSHEAITMIDQIRSDAGDMTAAQRSITDLAPKFNSQHDHVCHDSTQR